MNVAAADVTRRPPRSLARAAERVGRKMRAERWRSRFARVIAGAARAIVRAGDTPWAAAWYALLVGAIFLPVDFEPAALRGSRGTDFISTAWQVKAAAVALTLAVVLFAFEGARSSRWS